MDAIRPECCALIFLVLFAAPLHAGGAAPLGVLWEAPACAYRKLGSVSIEAGHRVHERTTDVTAASYPKAFAKLLAAADAKGGNAVILRGHQATYFSRRGATRKPVHVQLRGAAIGIDDASGCNLVAIDPREYARRVKNDQSATMTSEAAYSDD